MGNISENEKCLQIGMLVLFFPPNICQIQLSSIFAEDATQTIDKHCSIFQVSSLPWSSKTQFAIALTAPFSTISLEV